MRKEVGRNSGKRRREKRVKGEGGRDKGERKEKRQHGDISYVT